MKFVKLLSIITVMLVLFASSSYGQASSIFPAKGKIGVGFTAGSNSTLGAHAVYAIEQQIHIGLRAGFLFESGANDDESSTYIYLAPYGRYFIDMEWKTFKPFIDGSFVVRSISVTERYGSVTDVHTVTTTGFNLAVGAEWFPYPTLGVYGAFQFIELQIDPMNFIAGLGAPSIGIEWFIK